MIFSGNWPDFRSSVCSVPGHRRQRAQQARLPPQTSESDPALLRILSNRLREFRLRLHVLGKTGQFYGFPHRPLVQLLVLARL